ncbi:MULTISPECIES: DUF3408 domain-containing protein [Bacteroides]|jgi:TorA maturation chaperone TorD|uniref:DUF3408 domain-containing protein n=1 Tax=Bacteroides TaxID=816 RepID=UPI0005169C87|nr:MULTISPECIES: DUF3408 domain-containing protein [Bacteroides]MCM0347394.1 DUF3408 domain-containing protein [Bacteroides fragilis]MCM0362564.1 DUF3408 domain-containing protein [Bacteroides fragilis]MCY6331288.1 DUF3408 domain-containing protein [Bacteroides fragilis]MDA1489492.1 DUF3408 domain-containing protein [Bacteroides fragilis]QCQ54870.1 DUF3408 domain-containing protein [Bacteroides fragilis]
MKTKELDLDNIDPDFIISSFKTNGKPSVPVPASTEAIQAEISRQPVEKVETNKPETDTGTRKRKNNQENYESLFIKETNLTARLGKSVYIRKEYHERILKIIQVIGENEVSLFSYLDNVLTHHFQTFQNDITEIYKQKNKGLF